MVSRRIKNPSGATLLELLIAMALFLGIIAPIMAFFSRTISRSLVAQEEKGEISRIQESFQSLSRAFPPASQVDYAVVPDIKNIQVPSPSGGQVQNVSQDALFLLFPSIDPSVERLLVTISLVPGKMLSGIRTYELVMREYAISDSQRGSPVSFWSGRSAQILPGSLATLQMVGDPYLELRESKAVGGSFYELSFVNSKGIVDCRAKRLFRVGGVNGEYFLKEEYYDYRFGF